MLITGPYYFSPTGAMAEQVHFAVGDTEAQRTGMGSPTARGEGPGFPGMALGPPCPASAHVDVVVEGVQGLHQALHGHQHVLHHVVLLVQLA